MILVGVVLAVGLGLWSYFEVAWYVGCLVSAGVSMLVTLFSTLIPKPH